MRSTWGALLGLTSILFAPILPVIGQDIAYPPAPGIATFDGGTVYSGSAQVGPEGSYLYFRKDFDNGVGYREGFSTVGGFLPLLLAPNYGFFGQGQMFVTDDGKFGGNLGGGYRYFVDSADRVFGVYGFLDFDESYGGASAEQIGIGIETLGPMWDFRANGYFPLDSDPRFVRLNALTGPPVFSGNNLILNGNALFDRSMTGGDAEIGVPLLDPSAFGRLRAYFGAYAYEGEKENQAGGRVRLEGHVNEHVTLGASFMHDDTNGDMVTMAVDIRGWNSRLPGMNNRQVSNKAKMFLPAVRQYRIAQERYLDTITTEALGPTGAPVRIVWVDNSNSGSGNGTFEDPFTSLPSNAAGADYILVRSGVSTETNPVLGGITLADNQRMFGEGVVFSIAVTGTEFGPQFNGNYSITSLLPSWSDAEPFPFLSNPGGNVITLANNNQVGGFNIVDSAGHGITGSGINNFNLFDLNIGNSNPGLGNGGAGISLTNVSGIGTIDNFTFFNNAAGGLLVSNTNTADLTLAMRGTVQANPSVVVNPNVTGGAVGLSFVADNSNITADIEDYFNSGSGTGAILTATNGANLDVQLTRGSFDDTTVGDGVRITADNAALSFAFSSVTADNAAGHGLNIDVLNGASFNGAVTGTSSFSDANGDGVRLIVDNAPNAANALGFLGTSVNNSGGDGLHVELDNASVFNLAFQNGSITGSVGDSIDTNVDGTSTLNLLVNPSSLSGAGENGFRFNVVNSSVLNAQFDQVTIAGSGLNGILGTLNTLGTANFLFTGTNVTSSGEHGMFITALGGSEFNGSFTNGSFNNNSQSAAGFDGINLVVNDATINVDLINTTAENTPGTSTQQNGLQYLAENGGQLDIDILGGSFSTNNADGIFGEVHDAGTLADLSVNGAFMTNNGGNGLNLIADTNSTAIVSIAGTNVSFSGDNGINLDVSTGATLLATVSGGTLASGNGLDGFVLNANDAGTIARLLMTGNNQFNNHASGAGVRITAADVDEILAIVAGSASNNAQQGVVFDITNVNDTATTPTAVAIGVVGAGTVNNNGLDGIEFNVTGSTINNLVTSGVSASNNALHGVQVNVDNSTVLDSGDPLNPAILLSGNSFSNNQGGSGIELNLDTVVVPANNVAIGGTNSISGNSVDGIRVNLLATPIDGLRIVGNNNVSNNGGRGLRFNLTGSNLTNLDVSNNSISGNAEAGIEFFGNSNVDGTFDGNNISGNQNAGILVNLNNNKTFTAVLTGNTISNNEGAGIRINAQDNSEFSLTAGGPALADANVFNNNLGAGIGIVMRDNARGFLGVENSTFSNTRLGGGPFLAGQGIHVRMFGSSDLDALSYIETSTFTNNAVAGVDFHVQDNAIIEGLRIEGNEFENTGESIRFLRLANGRIGSLSAVQILDNEITGGGTGISLAARNSNNLDSYVLNDNIITGVGGVGILLEHGFDARMNVNMDGNEITGSGSDGIRSFQTAGTLPIELRRLSGIWQNLLVDDNRGDGLQLGARLDGISLITSNITNNDGIGLNVIGPGTMSASFNLIEGNGSHGIDVNGVGFKSMSFNNNTIRLNGGDGFRLVNNGNELGFGFTITANNNLIELNDSRGINVLNQGTADTSFTANGNTINGNGNEGVFVMNTASTSQLADFGAALEADGAVNAIPRLNLTFNNNTVLGNGNDGTTIGGAGGFVLRVGTSDAHTFGENGAASYTTDGGTASSGRGGVVATVSGNTFIGNAGLDVYIDSFVSTVDPAATVSGDGWTDQNEDPRDNTNDTFDIDGYEADPIARLDLVFTNNIGNEWDMTNPGAFYANDEPVFKSRTQDQDTAADDAVSPPDDPGPFGSGTRQRNAQRFAFRGALPPTIAAGSTYLFPGVGTSSFRVQQSGNVFATGTGFIIDSAPYLNPAADAFGVNAGDTFSGASGGPFGIDFMPWGWSILP